MSFSPQTGCSVPPERQASNRHSEQVAPTTQDTPVLNRITWEVTPPREDAPRGGRVKPDAPRGPRIALAASAPRGLYPSDGGLRA